MELIETILRLFIIALLFAVAVELYIVIGALEDLGAHFTMIREILR